MSERTEDLDDDMFSGDNLYVANCIVFLKQFPGTHNINYKHTVSELCDVLSKDYNSPMPYLVLLSTLGAQGYKVEINSSTGAAYTNIGTSAFKGLRHKLVWMKRYHRPPADEVASESDDEEGYIN